MYADMSCIGHAYVRPRTGRSQRHKSTLATRTWIIPRSLAIPDYRNIARRCDIVKMNEADQCGARTFAIRCVVRVLSMLRKVTELRGSTAHPDCSQSHEQKAEITAIMPRISELKKLSHHMNSKIHSSPP